MQNFERNFSFLFLLKRVGVMDFFKANDVLKGPFVSAATTDAEKAALRREKLEACKVVVDHLFTPPVMFVNTAEDRAHTPHRWL